jgi:ribonuclease Z
MANKIKITFLGTAANIPSAKRNHTGILINYNEENILVDCGEGIQRQFRKAKLNPCKITKIILTHKHGDHTFGLPGLLSTLNSSDYNKDLIIYGPRGIKSFLNKFLDLTNVSQNFRFEIKEVFSKGMTSKEASRKFFENEDFYLEAEKMEHGVPVNAYNFVLKSKRRINKEKLKKSGLPKTKLLKDLSEGKDIVFEGKKFKAKDLTYIEEGKKISIVLDTLVNPRIKPFIKDAKFFISEGVFLSEDSEIAKENGHTTVKEISKIAKSGNVSELILTHISQRYEIRLRDVLSEAKKNFKNSRIANDFDIITL